jgi:hypothetical protein
MRIVWLASYPKSGNTWLRFLLHHYLHGEVTESAAVERAIPDLHTSGPEAVKALGEGPVAVKTHFMLTPGHPLLGESAGFVYVVRNPRDVLLSALNYFRMTVEGGEALSDADYARRFIRGMGYERWRERGFGTWPEHVASWLGGAPHLPHVLLRYEDLKADPAAALARVVRLLGAEPDPDRLAAAVAGSTFERMRDLEGRERDEGRESPVFAIHEQSRATGRTFMREGASGQSLAHLGEGVEAAFETRFGELSRFLGY